MPPRLDDTKRAAILATIKAGGGQSCRGIARQHGVSDHAVRKIAKENGIDDAWSRDQTKKATEAVVADNNARRAVLATRQLTLAELATEKAIEKIGNASASQASMIAAVAVDKHIALDKHDNDGLNLSAVDDWLKDVTGL